MKSLGLVCMFLFVAVTGYGLEIDASYLGFTYNLPAGWKLLDSPNPKPKYRELIGIDRTGQARIGVALVSGHVGGSLAHFQLHWLNGVRSGASDCKVVERSVFKTESKHRCLRTLARVTTKDGKLLSESYYFFQAWYGVLCVHCSGPGDGSFDATFESIMKTFRLTR